MASGTVQHPASVRTLTPDDLRGDLIQPGDALFGLVWINRERMSGTPCFAGTRVPLKNLFDYLEDGYTLDHFLSDFEGVTREQAVGIIEPRAIRAAF